MIDDSFITLPKGAFLPYLESAFRPCLATPSTKSLFTCTRPAGHGGRHADIHNNGFVTLVWAEGSGR